MRLRCLLMTHANNSIKNFLCYILNRNVKRVVFLLFLLHDAYCFVLFVIIFTIYFFKEHKCMNKSSTKRTHRRKTRRNSDKILSNQTIESCQENTHLSSNECVVNLDDRTSKTKNSFPNHTDSDGESEPLPVKPWSPMPNNFNGSSLQFTNNNNNNNNNSENNQEDNSSPQLTMAIRALFEMITEDLDKFVYSPAPNGLGDIQCRITRDKRGMEKGLFPTYYMHVERPGDGKKV